MEELYDVMGEKGPYAERRGKARLIGMRCTNCKVGFHVRAEFGCYIKLVEGSYCDLRRERQGRTDIIVRDIACPTCGCVNGVELDGELDEPRPTNGLVV